MTERSAFLIIAVTSCAVPLIGIRAETVELNPGTTTYDDRPSISVAQDGTTWIALHTYQNGSDGVAVRRVGRDGRVDKLRTISETGDTHGPPTIVADSVEHAYVVWSAKVEGYWHVVLREWKDDDWSDRRLVSDPTRNAIFPTAMLVGEKLLVAWSERIGKNFVIRGCYIEGTARQVFDISDEHINSYRPVLIQHGSDIWAF